MRLDLLSVRVVADLGGKRGRHAQAGQGDSDVERGASGVFGPGVGAGPVPLVDPDVDQRLADDQHPRGHRGQCSKSTDEYARSLDNRWSLLISRMVPLRERITSE